MSLRDGKHFVSTFGKIKIVFQIFQKNEMCTFVETTRWRAKSVVMRLLARAPEMLYIGSLTDVWRDSIVENGS